MNELLEKALELEDLRAFDTEATGLSVHLSPIEDREQRVLVFLGENASGKSLALRILAYQTKDAMAIASIRERCGPGDGFRAAMMYGDEKIHSTGSTTVSTVSAGFGNLSHEYSFLALDEPELGLSERYHHALGTFIGMEANKLKEDQTVIVISHSRTLVRALCSQLEKKPVVLSCGDTAPDLDLWFEDNKPHSLEDLLSLKERAHKVKRAIWKIEKSDKEDKKKK